MSMKNLRLLLVFVTFSAFGQNIEKVDLNSKFLNHERELLIYTPWEFEEEPNQKFEVFYVFDSQARELFDFVHSTLQFYRPQPVSFIVVGIISPYYEAQNWGRNTEMLPIPNHEETIEKYGGYLGKTDAFLDFIQKEAMPYIDSKYRTLPKKIAVGHSNSATMLMYSFLTRQNMFTDFIALSPNFAYDNEQIVDSMNSFNIETMNSNTFLFLGNANESEKTGWKGWGKAREKAYDILKEWKSNTKTTIEIQRFENESHWSSFPFGALNGIKAFLEYQYCDLNNIKTYYEDLEVKGLIEMNSNFLNALAYDALEKGKPEKAVLIINWAIKKYPNDTNLYDSKGEFYERLEAFDNAKNSYKKGIEVLRKNMVNMDDKAYVETLKHYQEKLKRLENR